MTTAERMYDNMDEKHSSILKQFREKVSDILKPKHDDFYLLRWLVARDFDIKKSEKMLRNHMEWRERHGVDTLLHDYTPPEVLRKYWTGGQVGRDKEGAVLWVEPFGNIDLKGLMSSAMKRDILKHQTYVIECVYRSFAELSALENRRISCLVNIFDLDNFGLRHLWRPGVDMFNAMLSIFEDHYPETLKVTYVVNAPTIFPIAYKLVSPFLSEETRRKTKIMGRSYKKELLQYIDADQLPVHYGGTKVGADGDPKCSDLIRYGGEVPEHYHMNLINSQPRLDVKEITVPRASMVKLKYNITSPGSVLRYNFMTVDNDVSFGVYKDSESGDTKCKKMTEVLQSQRVDALNLIYNFMTVDNDVSFGVYKESESGDTKCKKMIEVLQSQRVNSHMVPEEGSVTCHVCGVYVVVFDNTYSWLRSKKLSYTIDILTNSPSHVPKAEESFELLCKPTDSEQ